MIFLSFDIEEFDNPFPCSQNLSFAQQMEISVRGTTAILDLLERCKVNATFFCTANFAKNAPVLIERMVREGHEVASHGFYHNRFEPEHLQQSREVLESLSGVPVQGFRMPNMRNVHPGELERAGYIYNSSLNPTYLPGKYNHFKEPRKAFMQGNIVQIPASVTPVIRIPLFWLSLHVFPLPLYLYLAKAAHNKDGYLNLYFHPWEFVDLKAESLALPSYVMHNSGPVLIERLTRFIGWFQQKNVSFGHLKECAAAFEANK